MFARWVVLVAAVVACACGKSYGANDPPPDDAGVVDASVAPIPDAGSTFEAGIDSGGSGCNERALYFDGKQSVRVPHQPALDLAGAFTIEAWIRPALSPTSEGHIFSHHHHEPSIGWVLLISQNRPQARVYGKQGTNNQILVAGDSATSAVIVPDAWKHIAGTFDGAKLRVYYGGTLIHEADGAGLTRGNFTDALVLGNSASSSPFHFIGFMDEMRISRVARYIGTAIAKPQDRFAMDGDTVALYHFDEPNGDDALDVTTNHNGKLETTDPSAPIVRVEAPCISSR